MLRSNIGHLAFAQRLNEILRWCNRGGYRMQVVCIQKRKCICIRHVLMALLKNSQRERRLSLENLPHIDKVVVRNCVETWMREKTVLYMSISKTKKGCEELQHGLCIMCTTSEHHHFPRSLELDKAYNKWKDYVEEQMDGK